MTSESSTTPGNIFMFANFIPVFDGKHPIQDFLQELDETAKMAGWTDDITIKVAKTKFKGHPETVLRQNVDLRSCTTMKDFKKKATEAFTTESRPMSIRLQDVMTCVQMPNESINDYADRLRTLGKQLTEYDSTTQTKTLKDQTLCAQFIKGLRGPMTRRIVLSQKPNSFAEALELARAEERNESIYQTNRSPEEATVAHIPTPDDPLVQINARLAAIELRQLEQPTQPPQPSFRRPLNRRPPPIRRACYICGRTNHLQRECFYNPQRQSQPFRPRTPSRGRRQFTYNSRQPRTQRRSITPNRPRSYSRSSYRSESASPQRRQHQASRNSYRHESRSPSPCPTPSPDRRRQD